MDPFYGYTLISFTNLSFEDHQESLIYVSCCRGVFRILPDIFDGAFLGN